MACSSTTTHLPPQWVVNGSIQNYMNVGCLSAKYSLTHGVQFNFHTKNRSSVLNTNFVMRKFKFNMTYAGCLVFFTT